MLTKGFRSIFAGRRFGIDAEDRLVMKERPLIGSPWNRGAVCEWYDDFLGDVIDAQYGVQTGSDAAAVAFAYSAATNGMIRGTMGAGAGASMAANGVQVHTALNWKANAGNLFMQARVKMSAITTIAVFVGFTDQIAALEMPIHASGTANGLTTNATDAVGLMFDTSMSDDYWWCTGVANDTDATAVSSTIAPTAGTYQRLAVEVDKSGNARFYIDGRTVGTVSSAVTATVALTPVVCGFRRSAATATLDLDWLHVMSDRV